MNDKHRIGGHSYLKEKYWRNILHPLNLSPKLNDNQLIKLIDVLRKQQDLDDDDLPDVKNTLYADKIKSKINLLHSYRIIHGDLGIQNIVLDNNDDILFIDFETTKYFDDYEENGYEKSIEGLLKREKNMPFC